jgi:hypothetical protein
MSVSNVWIEPICILKDLHYYNIAAAAATNNNNNNNHPLGGSNFLTINSYFLELYSSYLWFIDNFFSPILERLV